MEIPSKVINLCGRKFGRLTVTEYAGRSKKGARCWICTCDCGEVRKVFGSNLVRDNSTSCGCLGRQNSIKAHITHGHSGKKSRSSEYGIWASMISRCENPKVASYPRYGGRGIKVCVRWRKSFQEFLSDMGPRPQGKTLDRDKTNGNYCPSNCRWITPTQQNNNRRGNRRIEVDGITLTSSEWERKTGIRALTIRQRIDRGWPAKRAISEPTQNNKRNDCAKA